VHTDAHGMQMCPGVCRFIVPMLSSDAPDISRHSAVRLVSRLASLLAGEALALLLPATSTYYRLNMPLCIDGLSF
jgi:hypothetical protein